MKLSQTLNNDDICWVFCCFLFVFLFLFFVVVLFCFGFGFNCLGLTEFSIFLVLPTCLYVCKSYFDQYLSPMKLTLLPLLQIREREKKDLYSHTT